jgi:hypothetical protein
MRVARALDRVSTSVQKQTVLTVRELPMIGTLGDTSATPPRLR